MTAPDKSRHHRRARVERGLGGPFQCPLAHLGVQYLDSDMVLVADLAHRAYEAPHIEFAAADQQAMIDRRIAEISRRGQQPIIDFDAEDIGRAELRCQILVAGSRSHHMPDIEHDAAIGRSRPACELEHLIDRAQR